MPTSKKFENLVKNMAMIADANDIIEFNDYSRWECHLHKGNIHDIYDELAADPKTINKLALFGMRAKDPVVSFEWYGNTDEEWNEIMYSEGEYEEYHCAAEPPFLRVIVTPKATLLSSGMHEKTFYLLEDGTTGVITGDTGTRYPGYRRISAKYNKALESIARLIKKENVTRLRNRSEYTYIR